MSSAIACDSHRHLIDSGKYYRIETWDAGQRLIVNDRHICEGCLADWFKQESGRHVM